MARGKSSAKKEVTLRIRVAAGTPHHLEAKTYDTGSRAKGWLLSRLDERLKFAERYNHALRDVLSGFRQEIDELNVAALPVGQVRSWEGVDDVSGVRMLFTVEVLAK